MFPKKEEERKKKEIKKEKKERRDIIGRSRRNKTREISERWMAKCEIKGKEKREGRKKDSPYLPQDRKNVPFFFSPRARKVAFERTRKLVGGERVTVVAQSSHVIREENFYILGRYPSPLPFDVVIDVVETSTTLL